MKEPFAQVTDVTCRLESDDLGDPMWHADVVVESRDRTETSHDTCDDVIRLDLCFVDDCGRAVYAATTDQILPGRTTCDVTVGALVTGVYRVYVLCRMWGRRYESPAYEVHIP